jgi:hypothetical protein
VYRAMVEGRVLDCYLTTMCNLCTINNSLNKDMADNYNILEIVDD